MRTAHKVGRTFAETDVNEARYADGMFPEELNTLAQDWIRYQVAAKGSSEREETWYAVQMAFDLVDGEPDTLWGLILAVLARDRSNKIMENLSAGPMEDLLVKHGPLFIENVERQAKADPTFARMLGGVWKNRMNDDIWERMCKVRDRRGWDGLPG
jgi:hypothetical protein